MIANKKIQLYNFKYRNKKVTIFYCDLKNFEWYVSKENGRIILCMNKNYTEQEKRKILHKVIRKVS